MYFKRILEYRIQEFINVPDIIVITGMRRVGKTSLLQNIFKSISSSNKVMIDFENFLEQKIFDEIDFNNIVRNLGIYGINTNEQMYVFIDEVQLLPSVINQIKFLYDKYNIKFFLTGSSSFYLKDLFPESLAGRKIIFELFPLTFKEFLIFKQIERKNYKTLAEKDHNKNEIKYEKLKTYFKEYLQFGGFPQIVLSNKPTHKQEQLNDIFRSYYEKDIQNLSDFKNLKAFRNLIFLLMRRTGTRLDITKISSEVGVSRDTVYNYLSFLEGTYFISLISPYTLNADKEVSGRKKIYLCDTGILNHFAKVDDGCVFENCIYNNIRQYGIVNYYQKRTGPEIDFILPDIKTSIEVKLSGNERDMVKTFNLGKSIGMYDNYIFSLNYNKLKGIIPATEI